MELSPVRYARAPDGAEIAWAEMGSGPPLLVVPFGASGSWIEQMRRVGEMRSWVEGFAEFRRVLLYDLRGDGYSPPPLPNSLADMVADVIAVADASGSEAIALMTYGVNAPVVLETALAQEYRHIGLGFSGNPYGSDIIPSVTVRLELDPFEFVTPGLSGIFTIDRPDYRTTFTAEDHQGT